MFQFTTTTVINSNLDPNGLDLWTTQDKDDSAGTSAKLHVKRVGSFDADNVIALYKQDTVEPEKAKFTIDLSTLSGTKGDIYRLFLYVGLDEQSQDSRYANDLKSKGKPFSIDFEIKDAAANTAKALVKAINSTEAFTYGDKQLTVKVSGNSITVEATSEYQRFKVINVEKFDTTAANAWISGGEYVPEITIDSLTKVDTNAAADTAGKYFNGKSGFGTYSYLLHNLRLPTSANTDAFSANALEMPIIGGKYAQYTIHYCKNRGPLGLNAVGHEVKSTTVHVFYVLEAYKDTFETALKKLETDDVTLKEVK